MPELPEVETIRLQLERFLKGHRIEDVLISENKSFLGDKKDIIGAKFENLERLGKILCLNLNNGFSLMIHLKLTGQLIYRGPNLINTPPLSHKVVGGLPGKYTRVILKLDKGGVLYFNDMRIFGWIKVAKRLKVKPGNLINGLGKELPVVFNSSLPVLRLDEFAKILAKTRRPIKIVLMDQNKIAGIGNIYANDALFLAGIDPRRPANILNRDEQEKLYNSIVKVLKNGIKNGGSSENTFVGADGAEGKYQKLALVYGREGKKCLRCGALIKKIQLGGRGTYFCEQCQK